MQFLSPFATGTSVYSDEDILLSSLLKIQDFLGPDRRWWGTEYQVNKHKEGYARLKVALDRIESKALALKNAQNFSVCVPF